MNDRRLIRLLLVDDHPTSREPLAILLDRQDDLQVVSQAGSVAEAKAVLGTGVRVDIAIVDLDLGRGNGVGVIRELLRRQPRAQVLMLTGIVDERAYGRALIAGASGVVQKTASTDEVISAIRRLAAGEPIISPVEAARLIAMGEEDQRSREATRAQLDKLSARERDVLGYLAQGLSNEAIAEQMSVGTETVRSHVGRVLRKLEVSSRMQAALIGVRHGYGGEDEAFR